jgi:hypothetical protein
MASRRAWSSLLFLVGILFALVSLLANTYGLARSPGFGRVQKTGLVLGVVLIVLSFLARRTVNGRGKNNARRPP